MSTTTESLRVVLADAFQLYFAAHSFHWNVTSPLFSQYHSFFGEIYTSVWKSVDPIAEHIRAEGELAPATIMELISGASSPPINYIPGTPFEMIQELLALNTALRASLDQCRTNSENERRFGVVNFIEGLIDTHQKLDWQLRASLVV